ncbi:MAG: glycosyltransferase family 4 protein [Candidatus Aenigmarchaeota archaeon]|nr:glycosyltransferase family 4 protein [Candidatus Aenigmarchaeota archaeon]
MAKQRRILIFAPFFPPHIGGLETHVYEFSKHLGERGHKVTVFTPNIPKTREIEEPGKNLLVIRYPAIMFFSASQNAIPAFWSPGFWRLLNLAGKGNPEFVMSRTRFFFSSFLALLYAKATRKKYIHVEHGSAFVDMNNKAISFLSWAYDKTLGKLIFRGADKVVPISHAVRRFIQREFLDKGLEVIYRGIELDEIRKIPENKPFRKKYEKYTRLCVLGRLTKNKGIDVAIETFRILPKKQKEKSLLFIIGDGPDRGKLEALASGEKNIIFTGPMKRQEAIGTLKAMDIFLNPATSSGGLSTSLLEGMFLGLPVISTKFEGGGDVVFNGKNGLMVQASSNEELMDAIIKLMGNKALGKRLGKAASRYVYENFKWERVIDKYEGVFEELDQRNFAQIR